MGTRWMAEGSRGVCSYTEEEEQGPVGSMVEGSLVRTERGRGWRFLGCCADGVVSAIAGADQQLAVRCAGSRASVGVGGRVD